MCPMLKIGKVGVMPTDTIYGIVGSALKPEVVGKIYQLRKRATDKPMIILIPSLADLKQFDIQLTDKQIEFLRKIWPNPVSVVLECKSEKFKYLHRGTNTLAFRMPKDERLLRILVKTGPLVAPSANFEGEIPSETVKEAEKYFGESAFYVDGGLIKSVPSTIIKLYHNGRYVVLREGQYRV